MSKLVPIVFQHLCCSSHGIFGQAENGDGYWRDPNWGPERGWVPIPPPMGIAPEVKRRAVSGGSSKVKLARRQKRP